MPGPNETYQDLEDAYRKEGKQALKVVDSTQGDIKTYLDLEYNPEELPKIGIPRGKHDSGIYAPKKK